MVLPSGELHIREVGPEDGYKSYQCRTKHRLTGEARLSATKGRLVITGKYFTLPIFKYFFEHFEIKLLLMDCFMAIISLKRKFNSAKYNLLLLLKTVFF